jgi:hypothetical protein
MHGLYWDHNVNLVFSQYHWRRNGMDIYGSSSISHPLLKCLERNLHILLLIASTKSESSWENGDRHLSRSQTPD